MSNFIYSTSNNFDTPFFLDSDRLNSLENIIKPEFERLSALMDEQIEKEYEEKVQSDLTLARLSKKEPKGSEAEARKEEIRSRISRSLSYKRDFSLMIFLPENRKMQVDSFDQALKNVDLLNEIPYGFELDFRTGETRFNMKLDEGALSYRVSPEHLPESRSLFVAIEQWVKDVRLPFSQRLWLWLGSIPILWAGWFLVVVITTAILQSAVTLTILSGVAYFLLFTAILLQAMAGRPLWGIVN